MSRERKLCTSVSKVCLRVFLYLRERMGFSCAFTLSNTRDRTPTPSPTPVQDVHRSRLTVDTRLPCDEYFIKGETDDDEANYADNEYDYDKSPMFRVDHPPLPTLEEMQADFRSHLVKTPADQE